MTEPGVWIESWEYTKNWTYRRNFTSAVRASLDFGGESEGPPPFFKKKWIIWDWLRCNFPLSWGALIALFLVDLLSRSQFPHTTPHPHYFYANLDNLEDPYFKRWEVRIPRPPSGYPPVCPNRNRGYTPLDVADEKASASLCAKRACNWHGVMSAPSGDGTRLQLVTICRHHQDNSGWAAAAAELTNSLMTFHHQIPSLSSLSPVPTKRQSSSHFSPADN